MGICPIPQFPQPQQKACLNLDDMDRIELNEAFAAKSVACEKESHIDIYKFNVHEGAISLGHFWGCKGVLSWPFLTHASAVAHSHARYHLGTACIGGDKGIAVLL